MRSPHTHILTQRNTHLHKETHTATHTHIYERSKTTNDLFQLRNRTFLQIVDHPNSSSRGSASCSPLPTEAGQPSRESRCTAQSPQRSVPIKMSLAQSFCTDSEPAPRRSVRIGRNFCPDAENVTEPGQAAQGVLVGAFDRKNCHCLRIRQSYYSLIRVVGRSRLRRATSVSKKLLCVEPRVRSASSRA